MTEETRKKSSARGLLWLLPLAALLFLIGAVWTVSRRYEQQFLPGTTIMGVDCANMTAEMAADALRDAAERRTVCLGDSTGAEIAEIPLAVFFDDGELSALCADALSAQRASAGMFDWFFDRARPYEARPLEDITNARVKKVLRGILEDRSGQHGPTSARVEITDTGYTLVEEQQGNIVNMLVCAEAMTDALRTLSDLRKGIPAVIADGALIPPVLTADSQRITDVTDKLDAYLDLAVSVDFGSSVYTLTREDIRSVSHIEIRGYRVICEPVPELVKTLTDVLVDDYGTDGVFAKFLHAEETRPYVYYRVGDRGWTMDREALAGQIVSALESGTPAVITPEYDYTWYWKDYYSGYHVGDTFIEISLDNQYMWCYLDGKLLVETPIVTGDLARRNFTRRGCFRIAYKVEDVVLRGPTWNDHVDFWMPFDGGIGLHDSAWRDEYGEDIYMTDGSHGCINTPRDAMEVIFRNYNAGDFVIVY